MRQRLGGLLLLALAAGTVPACQRTPEGQTTRPTDAPASTAAVATAAAYPDECPRGTSDPSPQAKGPVTNLPLPRPIETSGPAAFRSAPSRDAPILFTASAPAALVLVDECHHWRRVRDYDGRDGWVNRRDLRAPTLWMTRP